MPNATSPDQAHTLREVIEAGLTLPADWYTDRTIFEIERDAVFRRTWQLVARADQLSEAGDYVTAVIADLPVVVVRGNDDVLRAFVNVCRHRLHEVAIGEGNRSTLQCPYHAWTYGLDGSLRAAPRAKREEHFDPCEFSLVPLSVGSFGPLVLVNPEADAGPIEEAYADLSHLLTERSFDLTRLRFRSRDEYELPCNWKVFIENSVECYHCPTAHPQFGKNYAVDPDVYRLEEYDFFSAQTTRKRTADAFGDLAYQFYYIFPGLFFVPTAWDEDGSLSFLRVFNVAPIDAERSRLVCDSYCLDSIDDATADDFDRLGKVFMGQDRELVESVQRGVRSGAVKQGQLLLDSERLIQHFYRMLERSLRA